MLSAFELFEFFIFSFSCLPPESIKIHVHAYDRYYPPVIWLLFTYDNDVLSEFRDQSLASTVVLTQGASRFTAGLLFSSQVLINHCRRREHDEMMSFKERQWNVKRMLIFRNCAFKRVIRTYRAWCGCNASWENMVGIACSGLWEPTNESGVHFSVMDF